MFLSEKQLLVLLSAMMLLSSFITFIGILYFGKRPAYGRYSSESKLKNVFVIKKSWFVSSIYYRQLYQLDLLGSFKKFRPSFYLSLVFGKLEHSI